MEKLYELKIRVGGSSNLTGSTERPPFSQNIAIICQLVLNVVIMRIVGTDNCHLNKFENLL